MIFRIERQLVSETMESDEGKEMSTSRSVSIVIPCRNERRFIAGCLDSIISNNYSGGSLEVLVVDGMSDDGTREIVQDYVQRHPYIRLLDNPKKITPVAFNIGIQHAKGEVIKIISAHTTCGKDYISKCVEYLDKYGADNVDGIMVTIPRDNTAAGRAIVRAISHRFGVGGSYFRTGSKEPRWVDAVPFSTYKREVFERIGFFKEELVHSQDMEFHKRLRRAGGKILLHPEAVSYYYARSDFKSFCKHNFRNGVWAIYPLKYTKILFSFRHMVPLIFVLSLLGTAILSVFIRGFVYLFVLIAGAYFLANICSSVDIAIKEKDLRYLLFSPIMFVTLHVSYGLGSLFGLGKMGIELLWEKLRSGKRS